MSPRFSRFGHKLTANSGILQLMEDLGRALQGEQRVYMLGGGNPAKIPQVIQALQEELQRLAQDPRRFSRTFTDYAEPQGLAEFRTAIAQLLRQRYGWPLGPENVVLTNGSQMAFALLFNLLAGPDPATGTLRRILFPILPEYIGYADVGWVPDLFVARRPRIELLEEPFFKYRVDFQQLPEDDSLAAVCVSRPSNPSGNVLTREEVQQLARWARERRLPLILDIAYGAPFPYIIFTDEEPYWDEHVVLCLSLSKLGLPGVRTGIVIAGEEVATALARMNAVFALAPTNVGAGLLLEWARNGRLLEIGPRWIQPFYRTRRDRALEWIDRFFRDFPYRVHVPQGTFFLWLWFPQLPVTAQELYQHLKGRGVLIVPGEYFFPGLDEAWAHAHQCIRVNVAGPEEVVREGLRLLAETVNELHQQPPTVNSEQAAVDARR